MKKFLLNVIIADLLALFSLYGKQNDTLKWINSQYYKRTYYATRTFETPIIDGKLDDECWKKGQWSDDFVQQIPQEGDKASQRTQLKILYDKKYIYVAFVCYDNELEKVQRLLGNRDEMIGDVVGINFDSYYDHKTGYEFNITAGGALVDLVVKNDGTPDYNWNAVWTGKTAMTDSGWTAEMKIPFSQLRYNNTTDKVWGMYSWRWIARNSEKVQWSLIPRKNAGFIYSFGELRGLDSLPTTRRIEVMPYTLAKLNQNTVEHNNPFSKKYEGNITAGVDGRLGLGTDFTLDYTLNPDFGQVEADPSEMNLSAFETFYAEKRPFFLEGKNIMDFNVDDDILFYSRRIGRTPKITIEADENNNKYVNNPTGTKILDAVKISGKTSNGLSIAALQSLTGRSYAHIDSAETTYSLPVEPLTNYILVRLQKDYNKGNSTLGGIFTSTHRDINHKVIYSLNRSAYVGGLNYFQYLYDRNYFFNIHTLYSSVYGKPEAILELQKSSARYFQRPDAHYVDLDSSLTFLKGYGGRIEIGRTRKNKLSFSNTFSFRSPGFEINDMGYQQMADYIKQKIVVRYNETQPSSIIREYSIGLENEHQWNYGGQHESHTYLLSSYFHWQNKWQSSFWIFRSLSALNSRELRGGPSLRTNPFWHFGVNFNTDWAQKVTFALNAYYSMDNISKSYDYQIAPKLFFKLSNRIRLSTHFSIQENHYDMMYVNTVNDNMNQTHYVMAHMNQIVYLFTLRASFSISPNMSMQYFGSPFISTGNYYNFKDITAPDDGVYFKRFYLLTQNDLSFNESQNKYEVNTPYFRYSFDNPDFQMREFKSNFVFRWEYKPGCVFYFVWANQINNSDKPYQSSYLSSLKNLFNTHASNIFMVKLNYYMNI